MDPRISFSSDFVDVELANNCESSYREAPVSSDFEFSVNNYSMITRAADEIFFKGMMAPLEGDSSCSTSRLRKMTLRDELLVDDDVFADESPCRATRSSAGWWKERLGLKTCHRVPTKKGDHHRHNGVLEKVVEEKSSVFVHPQEGLKSRQD